jgi:hypothetical protein
VLTYSSYCWASHAIAQNLQAVADDRVLSYLPLAHITERVYIEGLSLYSGLVVYLKVPPALTRNQGHGHFPAQGWCEFLRLPAFPVAEYLTKDSAFCNRFCQ